MTLAAVRAGLTARLETLGRAFPFEPESINPPTFIAPPPDGIAYDQTMRGSAALNKYDFKVRAYFTRASAKHSQDALCDAIEPTGATSVKAAIEGDRNPGVGCFFTDGVPAADDVICSSVEDTGVYVVGGTEYVGATFTVTVYARS